MGPSSAFKLKTSEDRCTLWGNLKTFKNRQTGCCIHVSIISHTIYELHQNNSYSLLFEKGKQMQTAVNQFEFGFQLKPDTQWIFFNRISKTKYVLYSRKLSLAVKVKTEVSIHKNFNLTLLLLNFPVLNKNTRLEPAAVKPHVKWVPRNACNTLFSPSIILQRKYWIDVFNIV